jgi:hypothetical protein
VFPLDRVEVRLEAVHKQFSFLGNDHPFPPNSTFSNTRGHAWEYPLFGTYRFGDSPVQLFAGGGLSLGGSVKGTSEFTTFNSSTGTTTNSTEAYRGSSAKAYYLTGGFDRSIGILSVRPEIRYARWSRYADSENATLHSRNSLEFVIGFSLRASERRP